MAMGRASVSADRESMKLLAVCALAVGCSVVGCRSQANGGEAQPRGLGPADRAAAPWVQTRLSFDPSSTPAVWRIELEARGLGEAKGLVLELSNWGEWLRLDDYYLRDLSSDPPLRRTDRRNVFEVLAPPGWDGELRAIYELPVVELGSNARESFGLLPYVAASYSFGFAGNTLIAPVWDGMPEDIERWVEIQVPEAWTIASGYAAPARGRMRARIAPGFGNSAIAFGRPVAEAHAVAAGVPLYVVQFGGSDPVAAPLVQFAETYVEACARSLGVAPARALSLIATEPGFGGTRTDGVIAIGCPAGLDGQTDPYTLHFLAHEIFHDWLGGQLQSSAEGEQLAWFWEGFTEYLSLWHLAYSGAVPRSWFAERVLDWEGDLVENDHWGQVAFADPSVAWRDPAIEPLAYKGSALLAFELDATLRQDGGPGLGALLRDLLSQDGGRYDLESIRRWIVAQGLEDFWREHVQAARRIDPRPALRAIGYEELARPRSLAYVGVRLDQGGPFGTVVAVDARGPSAGRILEGDRVSGLTPTRAEVHGAEQYAPEFPFGLAYYEPAQTVRIDVERGSEHLQIWVEPRVIDGAPAVAYEPGVRLDAFFR